MEGDVIPAVNHKGIALGYIGLAVNVEYGIGRVDAYVIKTEHPDCTGERSGSVLKHAELAWGALAAACSLRGYPDCLLGILILNNFGVKTYSGACYRAGELVKHRSVGVGVIHIEFDLVCCA